jgi:hypothetical protein
MSDYFGDIEPFVERRAHWRDERHIDVREANEIEFWTKTLGVSVMGLLIAIDHVGTSADRVRGFLARRHNPRP